MLYCFNVNKDYWMILIIERYLYYYLFNLMLLILKCKVNDVY
jgi:hypothetical protein